MELIAFVLPHGVLELPAVVAGAVGLSLGASAWRRLRGRPSREEITAAVQRPFWELFGVGGVLAVAALIEGFVNPYDYRPFHAVVYRIGHVLLIRPNETRH